MSRSATVLLQPHSFASLDKKGRAKCHEGAATSDSSVPFSRFASALASSSSARSRAHLNKHTRKRLYTHLTRVSIYTSNKHIRKPLSLLASVFLPVCPKTENLMSCLPLAFIRERLGMSSPKREEEGGEEIDFVFPRWANHTEKKKTSYDGAWY